jgi:hypothetical protein
MTQQFNPPVGLSPVYSNRTEVISCETTSTNRVFPPNEEENNSRNVERRSFNSGFSTTNLTTVDLNSVAYVISGGANVTSGGSFRREMMIGNEGTTTTHVFPAIEQHSYSEHTVYSDFDYSLELPPTQALLASKKTKTLPTFLSHIPKEIKGPLKVLIIEDNKMLRKTLPLGISKLFAGRAIEFDMPKDFKDITKVTTNDSVEDITLRGNGDPQTFHILIGHKAPEEYDIIFMDIDLGALTDIPGATKLGYQLTEELNNYFKEPANANLKKPAIVKNSANDDEAKDFLLFNGSVNKLKCENPEFILQSLFISPLSIIGTSDLCDAS